MSIYTDIARAAYRAYAQTTNNKNFSGGEMPPFDVLPETIKTAWEAAVACARAEPGPYSALDLGPIKVRLAGASPGEWQHHPDDKTYSNSPQMVWGAKGPGYGTIAETCSGGIFAYPGGQQARDAEFIAHSRMDVENMVLEIERLRADLVRRCGVVTTSGEGGF